MENKTENTCALDELKQLFASYERKICNIRATKEESLRKALAEDVETEIARLKNRHMANTLIDVVLAIAIALVFKNFSTGWSRMLPYLSLLVACVLNAAIEALEYKHLSSMKLASIGAVEVALKAERYNLLTKLHHLWSLIIGVPLGLFAVPQFCAVLKGWDFYATNLFGHPYHLFVLALALTVGIGAQVLYYSKIRSTISSLKDNISQYRQLISNFYE